MTPRKNYITIKELTVDAVIGVHAWEQQATQPLILDISFAVDAAIIAQHDTIEHTVNYDNIVHCIEEFIQNTHFKLIETLAHQLKIYLQSQFNFSDLKLKITKPYAIKKARGVEIVIED